MLLLELFSSQMPERRIDFLGVLNKEILTAFESWKTSPHSDICLIKLNTLFELAEKTGLDTTLEVDQEAITKRDDGFFRILPEEAAICEGEQGGFRVYNIQPTLNDPNKDPCVLWACSASGEPALVYYHMRDGEIGRFRLSDIVSITLR